MGKKDKQSKGDGDVGVASAAEQLASLTLVTQVGFSGLYGAFDQFQTPPAVAGNPTTSKGGDGKKGGEKNTAATSANTTTNEGGKGGTKEKGKGKDKGGSGGGGKKQNASPTEVNVSILDIRVGKIVEVEPHPDADGLYLEQIDVGEEKPRQVVSGLRKFVPIEDMKDREVVVILNLKPAKMRGVVSNGMVLCASNDDHTKVEPLAPPKGLSYGEKVTFQGFVGEPLDVINPKKKLLEKLFPDLKTDKEGVAMYKNAAFTTTKGVCKATLTNAWVK